MRLDTRIFLSQANLLKQFLIGFLFIGLDN